VSAPAPDTWRRASRGGRVLLAGTTASKVLHFATDVLVSRVLGVVAFGVVSASMSVVFILGEVCQLGIQRGVLRIASLRHGRGEGGSDARLLRKALAIPLGLGAMAVAIVALVRRPLTTALFGDAVDPWLLVLFSLAIPLGGVVSVLQFAARAERRFRVDALVGEILRLGLPLAAIAGLLALGFGLWGVAAGLVAGLAATSVAGARLVVRSGGHGEPEPIGPLLRVALPLALASSAVLLMNELDKVLLAVFREEREVGLYNAAFRLSRQANFLLPALTGALAPWVAPMIAAGRIEELRDLYRRTTGWTLAFGLSVFGLLAGFAPAFLAVFGAGFPDAGPLLIVLTAGQLVIAAAGGAAMVLQFSGAERRESKNALVGLGTNVVLDVALIPRFGAMGAAAATAAALALLSALRVVQARAVVGVLPYGAVTGHALRGAAASLIAAAAGGGLARLAGASPLVVAGAAAAGWLGGWGAFLVLRRGGLSLTGEAPPPQPPSPPVAAAPEPSSSAPVARRSHSPIAATCERPIE